MERSGGGGFGRAFAREKILAAPERACLHQWGRRDYGEVLALQEALRERRRADQIVDCWLAGEHPLVITQGVRGRGDDLVAGALVPGEIPVFSIDRGGMTTLHNPGQLVIYPILRTLPGLLAQARLALALLESVRDWLDLHTGIRSEIERGRPGLYIGGRKLAAIGISIHGCVSMHGIAINLCNDLSPWRRIVPCGEPQTRPITLSELAGHRYEPQEFIPLIPDWLRTSWGYDQVEAGLPVPAVYPSSVLP